MENEITKERITQLNIKDPIMIDDLGDRDWETI